MEVQGALVDVGLLDFWGICRVDETRCKVLDLGLFPNEFSSWLAVELLNGTVFFLDRLLLLKEVIVSMVLTLLIKKSENSCSISCLSFSLSAVNFSMLSNNSRLVFFCSLSSFLSDYNLLTCCISYFCKEDIISSTISEGNKNNYFSLMCWLAPDFYYIVEFYTYNSWMLLV